MLYRLYLRFFGLSIFIFEVKIGLLSKSLDTKKLNV